MAETTANSAFVQRSEPSFDICGEIVTLANTYGGELLIGVTKSGAVTGVADVKDTVERLDKMLRDYIRPDVTAFVEHEIREIGEKQVVAVKVSRGSQPPYRLAFGGFGAFGGYGGGGVGQIIAPQEHYIDFCKAFSHASLSFSSPR